MTLLRKSSTFGGAPDVDQHVVEPFLHQRAHDRTSAARPSAQ
jgi:hypothetical protein